MIVLIILNLYRLFPIFVACCLTRNRKIITADVKRWCCILRIEKKSYFTSLSILLLKYKEFRNYLCVRFGKVGKLLFRILFKPLECLLVNTKNIGSGLFIQHGIGTIISAEYIGSNCWINQNVTIGYQKGIFTAPKIGNNVEIKAGAVVAGDITIGDNVIIGANAVVLKSIPSNSMAYGYPLKVVDNKYITDGDGENVDE